jgi:hypothetical protein
VEAVPFAKFSRNQAVVVDQCPFPLQCEFDHGCPATQLLVLLFLLHFALPSKTLRVPAD